ncbi:MAG: glycosyltransferase family 4 protein [Acidimicrobiales bacterium]
MRAAFVTPRYGPEVVGGAESGARRLAEHLVASSGWEAEVFTTCALDHLSWANELPPGDVRLGGVEVHRFPTDRPRDPEGLVLDGRFRADPASATLEASRRWVELNGPVSTGLVEAVAASDADVVVFYPYLYHPTVAAITRTAAPAVLHPAAHDEPALYLPIFDETFAAADGFVFQTRAERELVQRVHPVAGRRQLLLPLGVPDPPPAGRPGAEVLGLGDRPYLVSVGRVDEHKGSVMLAAFFTTYKQRRPGPLALALVGPLSAEVPAHPDVVVTGVVSEQDKYDVLRDAVVSVAPSPLEAFCMVVPESWSVDVPVVVNAHCAATTEQCRRAGGGLWFDSYRHFEAVLDRLLADARLRSGLAARGRAYVEANYRWDLLSTRYARFLDAVATRGRPRAPARGDVRSRPSPRSVGSAAGRPSSRGKGRRRS